MTTVVKFLSAGRVERIPGLQVFLLLQLMDVLTTLVGFEKGTGGGEPVRPLPRPFRPLNGSVASKMIAMMLAGFCVWSGRYQGDPLHQLLVCGFGFLERALIVWA